MGAIAYAGRRTERGCVVEALGADGARRPLDLRTDLWNHSPDGFEWGYGGSGPAQLALALLADVTGDGELAARQHQDFKWAGPARWRGDEWATWRLEAAAVRAWLADGGEPKVQVACTPGGAA